MKFVSFRIKNFRSIIDSGWCELSPDNITGFIGQNESGKTSVIEALNAFYDEELNQDFLRSDGTIPLIICSFEVNDDEFEELFNGLNLPTGLRAELKSNNSRINIQATWPKAGKCVISLEQKWMIELFSFADKSELARLSETPPVAVTTTPSAASASVVTTVSAPLTVDTAINLEVPEEIMTEKPTTSSIFIEALTEAMPEFIKFEDDYSLLPNEIDIADISAEKGKVQGQNGVRNLLTVIGIKPEDLIGKSSRMVQSMIDRCNKKVTADFQEFWSQKIGPNNKIDIEMGLKFHDALENPAKAGQPYLEFWVKDGDERLYPKQRSKGVRWFLSFYLQLKASKKESLTGQVLLIDEPGASLHARAQEDVLGVFESIKDKIQILYTTHSPYLIKPESLYRLLAVQRDNAEDNKSATKILDMNRIGQASSDTMFPVYTIIGVDLTHQGVVEKKDNILLEEPSAHYYMMAFNKLVKGTHAMHFMPATGVTKLPTLVNLFKGWGLEFGVAVDDDSSGRKIYNELKKTWYSDDDEEARKHIYKIKNCNGIEDIFSKTDFKKYILKNNSAPVVKSNTDYLKTISGKSAISKIVLAYDFYKRVSEEEIKLSDFNSTTQTNIKKLMSVLASLL